VIFGGPLFGWSRHEWVDQNNKYIEHTLICIAAFRGTVDVKPAVMAIIKALSKYVGTDLKLDCVVIYHNHHLLASIDCTALL